MTDKNRDLTPQGNAPSWVDEVLSSSQPAAPRPVEGRHVVVSDPAPGSVGSGSAGSSQSGWEDWPPSRPAQDDLSRDDPARDLRLPGDPPRPAAPSFDPPFDADDWVARATGGQARDPRVEGAVSARTSTTGSSTAHTSTTYAAAPQTDAWGDPVRSGPVRPDPVRSGPVTPLPSSPMHLPLREDIGQKKLIAGLLAIFLGSLGVHKFYLGQNAAGLLMLAVNLGVWALAVVLSLLTLGFGALVLFPLAGFVSSALGVVGLIEGIIYLTKSDADFQRDYLYGKKAWF